MQKKVAAIIYVLLGTALQWYNEFPAANLPVNVNDLQRDLFAKFKVAKARYQWKKELEMCKYIPGISHD